MKEHSGEKFEDKHEIEKLKNKIGFGIKFWLEIQEKGRKNILGSGWAKLLESIDNTDNSEPKSLKKAAIECNYSYKYAWNILNKIKERSGKSSSITLKTNLLISGILDLRGKIFAPAGIM